jgi:hypothetical protein
VHKRSRGYEERLRRLEAAIPPAPPTRAEVERANARRYALCAAALEGQEPPFKLTKEEQTLLAQARQYAPVFWEMIDEGIITPDGQPGAPAAGRDGGPHL